MLQDQVVLTAQETHTPLSVILDLDFLSFESLHTSVVRLRAQRTREAAWTAMMAAQGSVKGMKKMEKGWIKLSELKLMPEGVADAARFISKFGKGI